METRLLLFFWVNYAFESFKARFVREFAVAVSEWLSIVAIVKGSISVISSVFFYFYTICAAAEDVAAVDFSELLFWCGDGVYNVLSAVSNVLWSSGT